MYSTDGSEHKARKYTSCTVLMEVSTRQENVLSDFCSLANYSAAYEETKLNRVSDFRDFVYSLFPKAILVLLLFYSSVAGVVPCGSCKKSPRTSS